MAATSYRVTIKEFDHTFTSTASADEYLRYHGYELHRAESAHETIYKHMITGEELTLEQVTS